MEDGFAAYASSKAALNMAIRHMAAELKRKDDVSLFLKDWPIRNFHLLEIIGHYHTCHAPRRGRHVS